MMPQSLPPLISGARRRPFREMVSKGGDGCLTFSCVIFTPGGMRDSGSITKPEIAFSMNYRAIAPPLPSPRLRPQPQFTLFLHVVVDYCDVMVPLQAFPSKIAFCSCLRKRRIKAKQAWKKASRSANKSRRWAARHLPVSVGTFFDESLGEAKRLIEADDVGDAFERFRRKVMSPQFFIHPYTRLWYTYT